MKMSFQENFQGNTALFLVIQLSFLCRSLPLLLSNTLLLTFITAVPHTLAGVQAARFQQFVKYVDATVNLMPYLFKRSNVVLWSKVYPAVWNKYPGML